MSGISKSLLIALGVAGERVDKYSSMSFDRGESIVSKFTIACFASLIDRRYFCRL